MVTKARLKLIKSLSRKKNRSDNGLFIVEGYKSIRELCEVGINCDTIYVTQESQLLNDLKVEVISKPEMASISNLKSPPGYLAVFQIPQAGALPVEGPIIALENLQDPGNLGTIIRLADWFGIKHVVCDTQTVDLYNPKVIQASMGSIARVNIHYTDLNNYLSELEINIYPTGMQGQNIYETELNSNAVIVMGSESNGLSKKILDMAEPISIPKSSSHTTTESLNVAIATSIIVSEWMRPTTEK